MEDAENVLPQLSRDNLGLDDDVGMIVQETGTFRKASKEDVAKGEVSKEDGVVKSVLDKEAEGESTDADKEKQSENQSKDADTVDSTVRKNKPENVTEKLESGEKSEGKNECGKDSEGEKPENEDEMANPGDQSFSLFQQLSSTSNTFTRLVGKDESGKAMQVERTENKGEHLFQQSARIPTNAFTTLAGGTKFSRLAEPLNDGLLIDVIGKIVGRTEIQNRIVQGCPQKSLDITLENGRGDRLRCTLWGDYVQKFNKSVGGGITDPVIIVQFCRPKEFMNQISISTSYHVTKLILDNDSEEAKEFLKTFKTWDEESRSSTSFTLTQSIDLTEDTPADIRITKIKDLLKETEDGYYWVLGDVVCIENYKEWNYLGCNNKNCNRKVEREAEGYRCASCAKTIPFGEFKYKVTVCLKDKSGNASFVLWDKECRDLMGIPASKMRDIMIQRIGDARDFPEELETEVLKISGLFKTALRNASLYTRHQRARTFGVLSMITDPKTVAPYKPVEAPKDDGWDGYDFTKLNTEMLRSKEEESIKDVKGKNAVLEFNKEVEEIGLKDMGSTSKPSKKQRTGMD